METGSKAQLSNDELRHYIKMGELRANTLSTTAKDDGGFLLSLNLIRK